MANRKIEISVPTSITPQKLMVVALVIMAFVIGMLYQKVQNLQSGVANTTVNASPVAAAANPTIDIATIKGLWDKDIIKLGDANKKVLFVEVGDPSCPYCHVAAGQDKELNKAMGANFTLASDGGTYVAPLTEMKKLVDAGKASFAYIYFPGHGNGEMAMKALYCANEKGKFWQAHDLLMSQAGYQIQNGTDANQQPTKGPIVKNDKSQSGAMATFLQSAVDPGFLKSCLDSGKYDARLAADITIGTPFVKAAAPVGQSGGTPTFFVNDSPFGGAYSYKDMESIVTAALK
jgi:protein-disulfide isomerase